MLPKHWKKLLGRVALVVGVIVANSDLFDFGLLPINYTPPWVSKISEHYMRFVKSIYVCEKRIKIGYTVLRLPCYLLGLTINVN